uniref:Nuclear transcription factor Y subunit n=1 Tax=Solanum lycopersicum TaxID=4081 RepID=A0A3Q7FN36_SOLLC
MKWNVSDLISQVCYFGDSVASSIMTSSLHYHSDGSENEQSENQSEAHSESSSPAAGMSVPGTVTTNMHYVMPNQLGNGNPMIALLNTLGSFRLFEKAIGEYEPKKRILMHQVYWPRVSYKAQTAYPYPDPYYRSIFAPYDPQPYPPQPYPAQPMVHIQLMGIQQAGVPLPSDAIDEPVFVNAKQYHGILRRRQSRAKAESEKKLLKARKYPILQFTGNLDSLFVVHLLIYHFLLLSAK